jgi:hypothetical protein
MKCQGIAGIGWELVAKADRWFDVVAGFWTVFIFDSINPEENKNPGPIQRMHPSNSFFILRTQFTICKE